TDGVVRFSGSKTGGIGNCICIEHTADGYWSNYMHLASMSVSVGQTVKAGQRIGTMGNTGGDYAIHLHYELSPNGVFHSGGNTVNPQAYLGITGDNVTALPNPTG
ncbi:MAG TPA: M23 family metallopeptidase, partial [Lapidilactobacillus dextrinicus]|nr:M23 family metallopeptidase [Lapidilactobacillus dextrinicus]